MDCGTHEDAEEPGRVGRLSCIQVDVLGKRSGVGK